MGGVERIAASQHLNPRPALPVSPLLRNVRFGSAREHRTADWIVSLRPPVTTPAKTVLYVPCRLLRQKLEAYFAEEEWGKSLWRCPGITSGFVDRPASSPLRRNRVPNKLLNGAVAVPEARYPVFGIGKCMDIGSVSVAGILVCTPGTGRWLRRLQLTLLAPIFDG